MFSFTNKMDPLHYEVWERCTAFVGRVCADRDASHGLAHMRKVTEQAVLLYLMSTSSATTRAEQAGMLYRIILVAMLHDVADHKYDTDGTLFQQVEAFVEVEAAALLGRVAEGKTEEFFCPLPCRATSPDGVEQVKQLVLTALDAISYSKEHKRGMRWFVPALMRGSEVCPSMRDAHAQACSWVAVRDFVSDADKLEAIGEEGLLRCYEYTCERVRAAAVGATNKGGTSTATTMQGAAAAARIEREAGRALLKDVVEHFHEKLKRLLPEFIVTHPGKFLGTPRSAEMATLLAEWEAHGPPPVTVYWRNVAAEYVMHE